MPRTRYQRIQDPDGRPPPEAPKTSWDSLKLGGLPVPDPVTPEMLGALRGPQDTLDDPPRSPVRIASVTLPTILGYRAIDFQSEAEGLLANQPTQYASHPTLRARYIFDAFSGICVYGSVSLPDQTYQVTGRRHGYGDTYVLSVQIHLDQIIASQSIHLIHHAFAEVTTQLLQPTHESIMSQFT